MGVQEEREMIAVVNIWRLIKVLERDTIDHAQPIETILE
jgi:hypothetical protein